MIPSSNRKRILVVDDAVDTLQKTKKCLEAEGWHVTTATCAADAIASIHNEGVPHLAILDIMLPDIDGFQLAKELLQFGRIPFIFISALTDSATATKALESYAEDFISKPFAPAELAIRVQLIMRRLPAEQLFLPPTPRKRSAQRPVKSR